jgi:hypothetical protein
MPVLSTVGAASLGAFGAFKGFSVPSVFIVATGGTIYVDPTDANYKIHEFTSSGTFTVTNAPSAATLQVLLIAGGGGGRLNGGGAGGYIYRSALPVSIGSYSVTIGTGGDPYIYSVSTTKGGDSSFAGLVALGGGPGGLYVDSIPRSDGGSGGGSLSGSIGLQPTSASGGFGTYGGPGLYGSGGGAGGVGNTNAGGLGRTADIISSSGTYEVMAAGGWGRPDNGVYPPVALPAYGVPGNGGWGGGADDENGVYVAYGYGSDGILRVRYKFQ